MVKSSHHLIIGCGYLGKRLLALLSKQNCWYTNRSPDSNAYALMLDINVKDTWASLDVLSDKKNLMIYCMVPPSRIETDLFLDFSHRLNQLHTKHSILVSSTVVYGNSERIVDAESEVEIDSNRAERQYKIEQVWLKNIDAPGIVRSAGIYGEERLIGRNAILNGEAINGNPNGWLNLIEVNDLASLLKQIGELDEPEKIELASDGTPVKRIDYYSHLAKNLKQAPPVFNKGDESRGVGRRCDNKLTVKRTGWQPKYSDIHSALDDFII